MQSFADFKSQQLRVYKRLYQHYSDEKFLEMYNSLIEYRQKFKGCINVNQVVELIHGKNDYELIISPNWTGSVTDHQDLVLLLKATNKFNNPFKKELSCEVLSFGTITVLAGSLEAVVGGETVGSRRVVHSKGIYSVNLKTSGLIKLEGRSNLNKEIATFEFLK